MIFLVFYYSLFTIHHSLRLLVAHYLSQTTILQNIIVNIAKSITEIPANLLLYSFISTIP